MNPQPKPLPRVVDKAAQKRETARTLKAVCALVDVRDQHACRCCGVKSLLEHHHRISRGAGGGHTTANILLLCRLCHKLAQQYRILLEGASCDGPLKFAMSPSVVTHVFTARKLTIPTQVRIEQLPRD